MRLEGKQTSKQSVRSLFNHFYSILWAGTDGSVEGSWSQSSLDELCKGPIGLEGSTICSECMRGRLPHSRWHFVPVWSAGVWDESCAETQQQHLFSFWAHQKLEIIPTSKHSNATDLNTGHSWISCPRLCWIFSRSSFDHLWLSGGERNDRLSRQR